MEGITADELMRAVVVIMAVLAALITVDRVIDIIKKWRGPGVDIGKKLDVDKRRLDGHDAAIGDLQDAQQVLCTGVWALLEHELHNGNAAQMEGARDGIVNYLKGRIGKRQD